MSVKNQQMIKFLRSAFSRSAFGTASMSSMRYFLWGEHVERQGIANIARIFYAVSYAEHIHARNQFQKLEGGGEEKVVVANAVFGFGTIVEILQRAIDVECNEIDQLNMTCVEIDKPQNRNGDELSFHYVVEAKKSYLGMFRVALDAAKKDIDMRLGDVYVCRVCGHIGENISSGQCPICGAMTDRFAIFPAN